MNSLTYSLKCFVHQGVETSSAELQPSLFVKCYQGHITLQGPRRKKKIKADIS